VIADFLNGNSEFAIDPPKSGELPHFVTPSSEGWVRILPGLLEAEGGLDGFFMARLVRRA
jgi:16S rRNA (cytosine967-C5)-methyltransferase